ncbi:MAG: aminoacyl-tRNA hydrolase [Phycisphaeraceae bacterium]|nr:aminoacyl-tRNA hydrolase [Phycisphaeraceae bacterium]
MSPDESAAPHGSREPGRAAAPPAGAAVPPDPRRPVDAPAPRGAPPADALVAAPGVWVAADDLVLSFVRGRGPGGQNVNKVSSAAELRVPVGAIVGLTERGRARLARLAGSRLTIGDEIIFFSDEHRSQKRNREACIARLLDLLRTAAHEPRPRKKTKPSRGAVERRLTEKKRRGAQKQRRRGPEDA